MTQLAQAFKTDLAHRELEIPPEQLAARQARFIHVESWLIQFKFGQDQRGEYLDYYGINLALQAGMAGTEIDVSKDEI